MSTSSVTSASDLQIDYMTLLIAQLENQNPLDPLDNSDMASQLAMYSELSLVEGISDNFDTSLLLAQRNYATSLVGKTVTFYVEADDGTYSTETGTVDSVYYDIETGESDLVVTANDDDGTEYTLTLDGVILVEDTDTTTDTDTDTTTDTE